MSKRYPLGHAGNLAISAEPSAAAGAVLLLVIFSTIGRRVFRLSPREALAGGLLATALHFLSDLWHHAGHARAAERTGYPMTGVRLWGVLGTSLYPPDEPELPGEVHSARAMGGPKASAWLALAGAVAALLTRPLNRVAFMASVMLALENLLIFSVGAFLPLPFLETDGTTLRRQRQAHRKRMVVIQK